ncbi:hypothetical protein ACFVTX_01955 [Agromyces sp. NPDC058136]|uniref:hypothetical protein n=1 Tax=Agromyces sp. NPDC058136 TaxID=3346354 RepID=UPI0036D94AFF
MKLKNQLTTGVLALALLAGAGIATAAPAQALSYKSVTASTLSECKSALWNTMREYSRGGATISSIAGCTKTPTGKYQGSFAFGYY